MCVYKPAAGERPLWDFPGSVLARHEVAAYAVSQLLGWALVPPTVWREDAPAGPGVVQAWVPSDVSEDVAVLAPDQVGPGWLPVLAGTDEHDREVVVAHRDHERLADIALFDVLINNADRKAGHLLGDGDEVMAIDHGVAFHPQWKVRTVLWGFAGRPLSERQQGALEDCASALSGGGLDLPGVGAPALAALAERVGDLRRSPVFPSPRPGWPVVPWPLW
ncbi:MAG: hypothetical protein QG597_1800 [Actinomycetota bacterium]|nr:hypothetical protein [Actinomycetota bacterium]